MDILLILLGLLVGAVGLIMIIVNLIRKKPVKKYGATLLIGMVLLVTGGIMLDTDGEKPKEEPKTKVESENVKETSKSSKEKVNLDIYIKPTIVTNENEISIDIDTNVVDGSILEVTILSGDLESVSENITVKDGKANVKFNVKDKFKPGYLAGNIWLRFNNNEIKQPDNVKKAYGENGEKLKGKYAKENKGGKEGKSIIYTTESIAYPDKATAKEVSDKNYEELKAELIEIGNGVIIDIIEPTDSEHAKVIVSDAWYHSAEHEKERFATQVGDALEQILINTDRSKGEKFAIVNFYDNSGKRVAKRKATGGYKVLE